jgi:hypothetical protein
MTLASQGEKKGDSRIKGVSFIWFFYEESKANRLIKTVYIFVAYIQLKDGIY